MLNIHIELLIGLAINCHLILDPSSAAGCSHSRAYEFFIESITSSCPLLGYTCDSEVFFEYIRDQ